MRAQDVMTTKVVSVSPTATVEDIARLLIRHRISAVPVLDEDGMLVGIVSEGDLMRRPEARTSRRPSWWLTLVASRESLAADYVKQHGVRATDVMTPRVISVQEDTPVAEIATLLDRKRIKRVPVLRGTKLVGIVSRANLIQALANGAMSSRAIIVDDRTIETYIRDAMRREPWTESTTISVAVSDGMVIYRGIVRAENQRRALRVLAENAPGVVGVDVSGLALFDPRLHGSG